jgi:uncharacterized protein YfaS (alpha-2-macroglobulin family)
MKKYSLSVILFFPLLFSVILTGCRGAKTTPTAAVPSPTPAAVGDSSGGSADRLAALLKNPPAAAPRVVASDPAEGQSLALTGALRLTFDQAMDADKTAAAFQLTGADHQAVPGKVTWADERTLVFQPQQPLKAAAAYQAALGQGAVSKQGQALENNPSLSFTTASPLQISQIFPANEAKDVAAGSTITVMFNRPVTPLVIAEEQSQLPNPLTIDPPTEGRGEWVNTSLYVFHPAQALNSGQTYTVRIPAGLKGVDGDAVLTKDFSTSFTVAAPSINAIQVDDAALDSNLEGAALKPVIRTIFNQPMDPASVETTLHLTSSAGNVPLTFTWVDDPKTTVLVKPSRTLALDTKYTLTLDAQAAAASGGTLGQAVTRTFATVPAPAVASTSISDGQENADPYLQIFFASPMDFNSLAGHVVFNPALEVAKHSWYNPNDHSLNIYDLKPSTRYTVQMLPGMSDPNGYRIDSPLTLHFTTSALPASAYFSMPYPAIFRADGPQSFYLNSVNAESVDMELFKLSTETFLKTSAQQDSFSTYEGQPEDRIWQQQETLTAAAKDQNQLKEYTPTGADGQPLAPGIYFLGLNGKPMEYQGHYLDSRQIFVDTDNITLKVSPGQLLAWVTDLTSGKPTPNAHLTVYNLKYEKAGEGQTDENGLFQLAVDTQLSESDKQNYNPDQLDNMENYQRTWYVILDEPGRFAFGCSTWDSGASAGTFGLYDPYFQPWKAATSYVYTERPLYRPGQPVYFKGIVRNDDDLAYSVPSQKEVEVRISSYKQEVYKETLPLSEIGAFDGKFLLDAEADLGSYTLEVHWPGQEDTLLGSLTFDVAEYRRPEFQVNVSASPANLLPGDSLQASLSASYYSGGPLDAAKVNWTLTSDPFTFTPPEKFSGFSFIDEDAYFLNNQNNGADLGTVQVAQGEAQTGADGKATVDLTAQPAETGDSRTLTFEATATDFAGTAVSGRSQVVMHKSAVYPGVRMKSYVGNAGQPQTVEVTALDWDGKALAGQAVRVAVAEREWFSVQQEGDNGQLTWQTSYTDTPVTGEDVTLDENGLGTVQFTPEKGGVYHVHVTALDQHGNQGAAATNLWVSGPEYIAWQQSNDRTFQLVADKDSYAPGDTAQILVASPYQGETYALLTVERGHVRSNEVLKLEGNSTVYSLPITADMAPNVYLSAILVKGVDDSNPRPGFKVGMARLKVSTGEQALKVSLSADHDQAAPGDKVQYTVTTTTQSGEPAAADVSLALVDLSTLSLKDSTVPPLLDFFYSPRSLSVSTGVGMVLNIEDYNAAIAENPGSGQGMGSGGGKGSGIYGVIEVRQNFPDTAFWQADVQTDASGKASVSVTLPDNLTTWRMDARAVTSDTRVGQATLDLLATKPLLVRPQTPRFFVEGDQATLSAAVHNNTNQDLSVVVKLDATGLDVKDAAQQTVSIAANHQTLVSWQANVPSGVQRVDLTFSAEGGGFSDASKPTLAALDGQGLPVYRYEAPETVATAGQLNENGARQETIQLPANMKVSQGQLSVELAPSLAAGMTDGIDYLKTYPYQCNEQVTSSFLADVRLGQALKSAGLASDDQQAALKSEVNLALQRLYARQHADGGWGWWDEETSDRLTTAYVSLGLIEAKNAGFDVSERVYTNALKYVRSNTLTVNESSSSSKLNLQALMLYTLARAGQPEISQSVKLYDVRPSLSLYARGFLLQTLYQIDPQDARLKTIISDLASAAVLSASGAHWEEANSDSLNWNTNVRSTAIILDALATADPHNTLNAAAVRWLMANRTRGRWNGTQETTWSLLALTDWVQASGDLKPDYRYAAAFNGKPLADGSASPDTVRDVKTLTLDVTDLLTDQSNALVLARDGSAGALYYTANLNLWLPVNQVKALDRGIVISRQYFHPDDLEHPVTQAQQGDVLVARLTLVAPHDLHYVVVDDPLPAGFEAVDTSLKSAAQEGAPDVYDWERVGVDGWGWWYFTHSELRDEKVVLSTDMLPAGTYVYTYQVRASTPGAFNVISPTAQEFYFPDVYGRGDGSTFEVKP